MVNTALFYNIILLTAVTITTEKLKRKKKNQSRNPLRLTEVGWGRMDRVEVLSLLSQ